MSVTVVEATADEAAAIADLPGLSDSTRRTLAAALVADDHCCLVARAPDGTVVGAALGLLAVDEGHVVDVAVATAHRRQGVATTLLRALEARLRARGATGLTLEVRPSNAAARSLYRRLGFVDEGRRPAYYPDGEDAVLMWRRDAT